MENLKESLLERIEKIHDEYDRRDSCLMGDHDDLFDGLPDDDADVESLAEFPEYESLDERERLSESIKVVLKNFTLLLIEARLLDPQVKEPAELREIVKRECEKIPERFRAESTEEIEKKLFDGINF